MPEFVPQFVKVASVSDVPPGKMKEVKANGRTIALCNVSGTFYAIDNCCIHRGGPLAEGYLDNDRVECPWHGWRFDLKTGMTNANPGMKVSTYEVKIEGDAVLVGV